MSKTKKRLQTKWNDPRVPLGLGVLALFVLCLYAPLNMIYAAIAPIWEMFQENTEISVILQNLKESMPLSVFAVLNVLAFLGYVLWEGLLLSVRHNVLVSGLGDKLASQPTWAFHLKKFLSVTGTFLLFWVATVIFLAVCGVVLFTVSFLLSMGVILLLGESELVVNTTTIFLASVAFFSILFYSLPVSLRFVRDLDAWAVLKWRSNFRDFRLAGGRLLCVGLVNAFLKVGFFGLTFLLVIAYGAFLQTGFVFVYGVFFGVTEIVLAWILGRLFVWPAKKLSENQNSALEKMPKM